MADYSSYFGASIVQTSGRTAFFNGASNAIGQLYSQPTGDFNFLQPLFAAGINNPFLSNFGESGFSLTYNKGFDVNSPFSKSFISTFGSNYLGNKIDDQASMILKDGAAQNIYGAYTKSAIETFENKIQDDMKTIMGEPQN